MKKIQTRYITPDDFLEYTGIDLQARLKSTSNPSNDANAFLNRIEVRMEAYLNATFFKNVTVCYPQFSDYQKLHYKYALLEQALYVFKNGDISVDSGYDREHGQVIPPDKKKAIIIAPNAIDHLKLIGLWSSHIDGGIFPDGNLFNWWLGR